VKKLLGHTDPRSTDAYVQLADDDTIDKIRRRKNRARGTAPESPSRHLAATGELASPTGIEPGGNRPKSAKKNDSEPPNLVASLSPMLSRFAFAA
jgi:hypothetical protein